MQEKDNSIACYQATPYVSLGRTKCTTHDIDFTDTTIVGFYTCRTPLHHPFTYPTSHILGIFVS